MFRFVHPRPRAGRPHPGLAASPTVGASRPSRWPHFFQCLLGVRVFSDELRPWVLYFREPRRSMVLEGQENAKETEVKDPTEASLAVV